MNCWCEGLAAHGFNFFSVTPLGDSGVGALGIVYMLVMRFMLKGDAPGQQAGKRRTFRAILVSSREYRSTGRARVRRFALARQWWDSG
ncbi:hypothetical protein KCP73_21205 [Salmonella enterica subsp. enterica]|nr:hypothetical protein KCP73_21205 [Salmonella enterica subsp. enterica]